jgi:trimeric autotransporter adhesin
MLIICCSKKGENIPMNRHGDNYIILFAVTVMVTLTVGIVTAAPILVTGCSVISAPGEYHLISNIINSPATTCFEITSSNVIFDGNGYTIDGTDTALSHGIWIHGTTPLTNVVVSDVTLTQWDMGIYALFARNSVIRNIHTEDNTYAGISLSETNDTLIEGNEVKNNHVEEMYLWFSSNNTIRNNRIVSTSTPSLALLVTESRENRIYNNSINNSRGIIARYSNTWNTTKTAGTNIIGGSSIGGNFWATPNRNGYSQTCTDGDLNGFCDAPYILNANNTDWLPLKDPSSITGCGKIVTHGNYYLKNDILNSSAGSCIEIMGSDIRFEGEGHTIEGNGTSLSTGVTIYNLTKNPERVLITNMTVQNWGDGINWHPGSDAEITRSISRDNVRTGMHFQKLSGISVADSTVTGNGGTGIAIIESRNATLVRNRVTDQRAGSATDYGIILTDTIGSTIAHNNVSDNGNIGIILWSSTNTTVRNNTVTGNDNIGILLTSSGSYPSPAFNNTLEANTVNSNGNFGISLRLSSTKNRIMDNTVRDNLHTGIELSDNSTQNELQQNLITGNRVSGMYVESSGGNLIADNYFNNTKNFRNWTVSQNTWNTTKKTGPSIIDGPYTGGNYWAQPDGLGFSQTCPDTDGDGLCNTPYPLDSTNIDFLPLKEEGTINSCTVITQPGTYEVTSDVLNSTTVSCLRVLVSDVIINGNGHTIDGIHAGNSRGVYVYNDTQVLSNVTVKNLNLTDWSQGIFFNTTMKNRIDQNVIQDNYQGIETDRTSNSSISDNIVSGNTGHGILLHLNCRNNTISGNTVNDNLFSGIYIHEHSVDNIVTGNTADNNHNNGIFIQVASNRNSIRHNLVRGNLESGIYVWGSADNIIVDNSFNNSLNFRLRDILANTWNTTRHYQKNILGGPLSGGNSWAWPNGTGFSQTCPDTNNDGVCDIQYILDGNNTDQLPLVTLTLLPLPGYKNAPTDPDEDGFYEDLNANGRKDFNDVVLMFNQMQWIAANEPICAFDFNGNGRIDFNDIVKLFGEI